MVTFTIHILFTYLTRYENNCLKIYQFYTFDIKSTKQIDIVIILISTIIIKLKNVSSINYILYCFIEKKNYIHHKYFFELLLLLVFIFIAF